MHASDISILSLPTAAYLAGLIDGEGTITLSRLHRNENRRIVVSISNNDREFFDIDPSTNGRRGLAA